MSESYPELREIELPIAELLPIQAVGVKTHKMALIRKLGAVARPVLVALYEGEPDSPDASYLLLDGHNRAYINQKEGVESIRALAIENDEQAQRAPEASLYMFMNDCTTLDELRERYRTVYLPKLEERGITDIASLPVRAF